MQHTEQKPEWLPGPFPHSYSIRRGTAADDLAAPAGGRRWTVLLAGTTEDTIQSADAADTKQAAHEIGELAPEPIRGSAASREARSPANNLPGQQQA